MSGRANTFTTHDLSVLELAAAEAMAALEQFPAHQGPGQAV
jgi:hypothetical protein